jgi:hypothetical protein
VRFFSAEAISEAIEPEGVRELVGLETSARLAKDVGRLKHLPFQVDFQERYPSAYASAAEEDDFYDVEDVPEAQAENLLQGDDETRVAPYGPQT